MFITLIQNSPYCDKFIENSLKLCSVHKEYITHQNERFDWFGASFSPFIMDDPDRNILLQNRFSKNILARKFDPLLGLSVINYLEENMYSKYNQSNLSRIFVIKINLLLFFKIRCTL